MAEEHEMKTRNGQTRLQIWLRKRDREYLELAAAVYGTTMSKVVRQIIRERFGNLRIKNGKVDIRDNLAE